VRTNRFVVDLGAIEHNVRVLRTVVGSGVRIFAAVKANAYGFGLLPVGTALAKAGVDALGMIEAEDAVLLREAGVRVPLVLYGGDLIDEALVRVAETYALTLTIADWQSAVLVSQHARERVPVFAEIDVGLERFGFPVERAIDLMRRLLELPGLDLQGLYTHMHVPRDGNRESYVQWQFDRFRGLVEGLGREEVSITVALAASSDVLALTRSMNLDGVDVGKWLYGTLPRAGEIGLRCAFASLSSRITHIKSIDRTEFLDAAPIPLRPGLKIGVAPIGIAHGLAGLCCQEALVRGQRVKILGSPSLEHCRLDLTGIGDASIGDEVVLVGAQGRDEITLAELPVCEGGAATWRAALEVRGTVDRVYVP
jgi:alanine racemase